MLIQCTIDRNGPTSVCIRGTTHVFEKNDVGDYVCEVTAQDHVHWLLNFPKSYRPYEAKPYKAEAKKVEATEEVTAEPKSKKKSLGRPRKND